MNFSFKTNTYVNSKMTHLLTIEQVRWVCVSLLSVLLSFFTPVITFIEAILIMWGFNIWAGMRADKVTIVRCDNFSPKKLMHSLAILIMYLIVVALIFTVMKLCGDEKESLMAVKIITYIFLYVYLQNGLRNLIIAYPEEKAIHFIYHVVRFEYKRAMPSSIANVIERYEKEQNRKETETNAKD